MADAINSVIKNEMSCIKAAEKFDVPRSTLDRRARKIKAQTEIVRVENVKLKGTEFYLQKLKS